MKDARGEKQNPQWENTNTYANKHTTIQSRILTLRLGTEGERERERNTHREKKHTNNHSKSEMQT